MKVFNSDSSDRLLEKMFKIALDILWVLTLIFSLLFLGVPHDRVFDIAIIGYLIKSVNSLYFNTDTCINNLACRIIKKIDNKEGK